MPLSLLHRIFVHLWKRTEAMDKFLPMDLIEPDFFYSMRRNM